MLFRSSARCLPFTGALVAMVGGAKVLRVGLPVALSLSERAISQPTSTDTTTATVSEVTRRRGRIFTRSGYSPTWWPTRRTPVVAAWGAGDDDGAGFSIEGSMNVTFDLGGERTMTGGV